jgi:hypothetical protein
MAQSVVAAGRRRRRLAAALAGGLAALTLAGGAQAGDPKDHSADEGLGKFGTLSQTTCFVQGGCAPTAAMNSFIYLQNQNPWIGDSLTGPTPITALPALAARMGTNAAGSTFVLNFISGKETWFDQQGVAANFSAQVDPRLLNPTEQLAAPLIPGTTVGAPTAAFLTHELRAHEDVELIANKVVDGGGVDPSVGHYVTLVDLNWYDQDGNGVMDKTDWSSATNHAPPNLGYMDPAGGVFRSVNLWEQDGHLTLVGPTTGFTFNITAAISESPTPEPGAWLLLLTGFGALGAALRSQRAATT